MKRALAAALLAQALALPAVAADDGAAMHAAAAGFYGVYGSFHPSDGIPDERDRAKYEPFLSPALGALLKQAADAQARFTKANKDSPPLVEGDLFSSLFEGATSVAVGACKGDGRNASCIASLSHVDPGGKPVSWTDTVYLMNTPAGWRVDDIGYGGSWAFGNKGRLSETLRQVLAFQ